MVASYVTITKAFARSSCRVTDHTDTEERYHVPTRKTCFILSNSRSDIVQEVSMYELVFHRIELSVLELESLKLNTSTDCRSEPLSDTHL